MSSPKGVQLAVNAIWATIVMSAISGAIAARLGYISVGELAGSLFLYALICILPYKIGNRSNAARYVFVVLCGLSFMIMLAGVAKIDTPVLISTILQLPLTVFAIFQLFKPESNEWFKP